MIVELRFPESPHPPERVIFNQYVMLADYLRRVARVRDAITVWRDDAVCRPANALVQAGARGISDV